MTKSLVNRARFVTGVCALVLPLAIAGVVWAATPSGPAAVRAVQKAVSKKYEKYLPGNFFSVDCTLHHAKTTRRCAWEIYRSRPVQDGCVKAGYATVRLDAQSKAQATLRPITCRQAAAFAPLFN